MKLFSLYRNAPPDRHYRLSAMADKWQSISGAILALFLLAHLHFESSILFGKAAFYQVVQALEGGWFSADGHGYPWTTQVISALMLAVLVIHGATALRRFPVQLGQWRALRQHQQVIKHSDSRLWFWQLVTGFGLFFVVPMHLITMLIDPSIGPHLSAERVYHDGVWLLYIILLPMVVIHAVLGLYRLLLKWLACQSRRLLRTLAFVLIGYLLVLGLASLYEYLTIGSSLSLPVTPYRLP
ncbi:fumarate reductase cytochrome b subunit [Shewanella sp. NIFS-20-20]|uniref:fumarate reductase cytochrome b subunit n=1 Tax=Shewanella sp. NIFS-20-20 TaxID=2853806 RepID=UPI001C444E12|nr:fumarate reductase cytochrome b subunit [Shewanella sp. NIFS-20-20]MBV7317353.1 fumarate reductase cytochrome b subunit [Shewanella sp. NIFS-20-20]